MDNKTGLCLSVRQPWAWLIVNGWKDVENRTWPTKVRGMIGVHAGLKFDREGYEWVLNHLEEARALDTVNLPDPDAFERGGIVGVTRITDCLTRSYSPWFFGPYGFALDREHSRSLPFRPCRGKLGFFRPEFSHE